MKNIHQVNTQDCLPKLIGLSYGKFDCWGIVKQFYKLMYDIDLSGVSEDSKDSLDYKHNSTLTEMNKHKFKRVEEPRLGDIILLRIMGYNAHLGVYLGEGKFLHTLKNTDCVIDTIPKWKTRIEGYYRWPKFD